MGGERDFEDVDVVIWLAWGGGGIFANVVSGDRHW